MTFFWTLSSSTLYLCSGKANPKIKTPTTTYADSDKLLAGRKKFLGGPWFTLPCSKARNVSLPPLYLLQSKSFYYSTNCKKATFNSKKSLPAAPEFVFQAFLANRKVSLPKLKVFLLQSRSVFATSIAEKYREK